MNTIARHFLLLLLGLLLFTPIGMYGQDLSQAEVELQKVYIEGLTNQMIGDTEAAITAFEQVLEQDPRNAAAAFELGRVYQDVEDFQKALLYFEQAVREEPENTWYPRYLADLYQAMGRHLEAAAVFAQLVERHPDERELYFRWSYFLVLGRDIKGAIEVLDQLEARVGVEEDISSRKHSLYLGQGQKKEAEKELTRLVDAYPDKLDYRHLLAAFYQREGADTKAERVYQSILKRDPQDARAQLALSDKGKQLGQDGAYLESLQPIMSRVDVAIDSKIGKLLPFITRVAETGDQALADAVLPLTEELERVHPDDAKPFSASGDLYFHTRRYRQAIDKYEASLAQDQSVYPVWEQLLVAAYFAGDFLTIREQGTMALDFFPNQPTLFYYLALGEEALQELQAAKSLITEALFMTARNQNLQGQLQALLAQVEAQLGRGEAAADALAMAETLSGDNPLLQYHRANVLLQQGDAKAALEQAARAAQAVGNDPYILEGYAAVLYANGAFDTARQLLVDLPALENPRWPKLAERYGDILFRLGEIDAAVAQWQTAVDLGSLSKNLPKKIADRQIYE